MREVSVVNPGVLYPYYIGDAVGQIGSVRLDSVERFEATTGMTGEIAASAGVYL